MATSGWLSIIVARAGKRLNYLSSKPKAAFGFIRGAVHYKLSALS